ncbi:MAG: hypothetical protein ACK4RK_04865 [Gemmataceae bacterium]
MPYLDTPQSMCLCGVAHYLITPPVGIYHRMWGAATHDQATDVHQPLTATVLVTRSQHDPQDELCILAIDHCLLWDREMKALLQTVSTQAGVPREKLLVAFSHLPPAELYGKGIYQESIAVLAPGCLETLTQAIARQIEEWL